MILKVSLDSVPDTINQALRLLKVFFHIGLKLDPRDKIYCLSLVPKFVLILAEIDWPVEKRSCKQNTVGLGSTDSLKLVFTLLTELITIHVRFSIVQVGKTSFKKTLSRPLVGSAIFLNIHEDFHKLLEVRINVLGQRRHESSHRRKSRRGHENMRDGRSGNTKVGKRGSRQ